MWRNTLSKSSLHKRVAKLEQEHENRMWQEKLKDCNCPSSRNPNSTEMILMAFGREQYEAAMKVTCPVHGPRRPGDVACIVFVAPDGSIETPTADPQSSVEHEEND